MGMENNDLFREQAKRLRHIDDHTALSVGSEGFKVFGTGTHTSLNKSALVVREDTVFTAFTVGTVDVMTKYGITAVTFKAGEYLPGGGCITAFAISSGSVIAY
jgi:hypothetical protein